MPKSPPTMSFEQARSLLEMFQHASPDVVEMPAASQGQMVRAMVNVANSARAEASRGVASAWLAHGLVQHALGKKKSASWMPRVA